MSWSFNIPFKVEKAPSWTNPYVTDGLVAMWDGEWNAGGGVHDASAVVWKDLSGNGHDATVVDGQFGDDELVVESNGTEKIGATYTVPDSSVYEIYSVFNVSNGTWSDAVVASVRNASTHVVRGAIGVQCMANSNLSWKVNQLYTVYKTTDMQGYRSVSATADSSYTDWGTRADILGLCSLDGAIVRPVEGAFTGGSFPSEVIGYIPSITATHRIKRVAIYNRHLTAAEVAVNYAVDKARFNLS